MTPDWLHQILWYIGGLLGGGAVWYFLSQKNYHAALWSGYAAVVVALFAVALMIRNDIIKRQAPFFTRIHSVMTFRFPGWLVYRYTSHLGESLAPVGIAIVVEVTNERLVVVRMVDYFVDVKVSTQWIRVPNLQAVNWSEFFWANNGNLKNSTRLDFSENSFDAQARRITLQPGASIKGWMFFEWPRELRERTPRIERFRITLEDSHGQRQTNMLSGSVAGEAGGSVLVGGEWHVMPKDQAADLSAVRILPHTDVVDGLRK